MSITELNPLALFIGFLAGIGAVVAVIGRIDRASDSRYFYRLLLAVIFFVGAVIIVGTVSS